MRGLVDFERKRQRGCSDQAVSVRGEVGGSRADEETTGDEMDYGKGQRKRRHFRKKIRWSFCEAESSAGEQKESNFLGQCLSYFLLL